MSLRKRIDNTLGKFEKSFETYNQIEVSKSALLSNLRLFSEMSGALIIPVLKGNAYGHGIQQVALALKNEKLPYIAVDGYFEALRIREVSKQPVLIMGAILPQNFKNLRYDNFAFVVQDEASVRALGASGKKLKVHMECNTGMNRYGINRQDVEALTELIVSYKNLELEGIMSHLADSDGKDDKTVHAAVQQFDEMVAIVRACGASPSLVHVVQSAGSLRVKSQYANTIRLGIGLYGINPFPDGHILHDELAPKLHPAMKLTSTIAKVNNLNKGDQVSYNYTFTAPKNMRLGVLPLGYFEGVNRVLSNAGTVKLRDGFAPIAGRVCMNHTMIDLGASDANTGDRVIVYSDVPGDPNTIDAIAERHGLFNYNLLTNLSSDVRRVLVD
jgi:alanine racemase